VGKASWRQYSVHEVIDAIEGSFGIVTAIAQKLGCSRSTVYRYIDESVMVRQALEVERQRHVDLAEAKSLELIRAGDGSQVRFVLSRLGKDRGWVERKELTGSEGEAIQHVVKVIEGLDEDEL